MSTLRVDIDKHTFHTTSQKLYGFNAQKSEKLYNSMFGEKTKTASVSWFENPANTALFLRLWSSQVLMGIPAFEALQRIAQTLHGTDTHGETEVLLLCQEITTTQQLGEPLARRVMLTSPRLAQKLFMGCQLGSFTETLYFVAENYQAFADELCFMTETYRTENPT